MQGSQTSMTLTSEQWNAVGKGEAVGIDVDGKPCIIVLKDVYDKTRKIVDYSEMPPEEAYTAINEAWGDDPGLDVYQDYKR